MATLTPAQHEKWAIFRSMAMTRRSARTLSVLALAGFLCAPRARAAAPDAATLVARGVLALHAFEYEEANEAFRQAQAVDPSSVMACWGEAMTYHQTLWRNENVGSARQALARLGRTAAARAARAKTPKERMLLAAAET